MVKGEINGTFIGVANGIVEGSVNVNLLGGTAREEYENNESTAMENVDEGPLETENDTKEGC